MFWFNRSATTPARPIAIGVRLAEIAASKPKTRPLISPGVVSWTIESTIDLDGCDKVLVNVGSVGQPRDENPKASYAILDTEEKKVWVRRVDYDLDGAVNEIERNGLPPILGERLRLGK